MLGETLRKARLKAGLSQEEVAFRTKLSRNYVSLIELDQRRPTVDVLFRVCDAIGVKASKVIEAVERNRRT